jgi:hypothetical protein
MAARLFGDGPLDPDRIGVAGAAFVLRGTGEESLGLLERHLAELCDAAAGVIDAGLAATADDGGDDAR